jgi:two-component system NtrC family sensor kinase
MKILNVDDNDSVRYARSRILQRAGYVVVDASGGAEALRLVVEEKPALVLLDVQLPDVHGYEVCRQIKHNPDTASTMVLQISSTFIDVEDRVRSLDIGADAYLAEPVQPEELIASVKALLRLQQAEEGLRQARDALEVRVQNRTVELTRANAALRREVAARTQAQEELEQREYQLRLITDTVPALIGYVDVEQHLRFVNQQYATWFLRPLGDILGKSLRELVGEATYRLYLPHIQAVLSGQRVSFEHEEPLPQGKTRWGHVHLVPDLREAGNVRGFFVLVQNITALKQAEEQVRQQQALLFHSEKLAAMGSLLASVAHELNNPLATITMQSDLLSDELQDTGLHEQIAEIRQATGRCMRIVQNFLTLARRNPPQRMAIQFNAIVEEALDLLTHALNLDGITVHQQLADNLPLIGADPHQFRQVVVNLLINAQQALRENNAPRHITLTTRLDVEPRRIVFDIADNGPGVPAELQERLFEPFYTTKPAGVGTGLGLALCRGIVESHGGSIHLVSQSGPGAVFRIELPLEGASIRQEEPPVAPPASTDSETAQAILLVDDEVGVVKAFARLLRRDGYHVDIATNGRQALESLRVRDYDLILCDIRMPELDGPGLYQTLAHDRPHLLKRFLFLTGDTLSPEVVTFLHEAGAPHLTKPFGAAQGRHAVRQALQAER